MRALALALLALAPACAGTNAPAVDAPTPTSRRAVDPLPSWNGAEAKRAILAFVADATDPDSLGYVPRPQRVAVFDNDGTLWCEKPLYFQLAAMRDVAEDVVERDPSRRDDPLVAALTGDLDALLADPHRLLALLNDGHAGVTQEEFREIAERWLSTAVHPRFERRYTELVYQPMLELVDLFRAHGFQVWICSGGGQDFVRAIAGDLYGVPPERVIGSRTTKQLVFEDDRYWFVRQRSLAEPFNDGGGKVLNVESRLGRVPTVMVGNSDGDLPLLRYTDTNGFASLQVLLAHDDAEREYDYSTGAEAARAEAAERGWVVVSMARDFATVFPEPAGR